MSLTHWKRLENPDYIGAYAFQPNEEKVVTIKTVKREVITGADGRKEEKTIIYFVENEKPMVLNATNGKMITKMADTPYVEQWPGLRIALVVRDARFGGETIPAVRVAQKRLGRAETVQKCPDCNKPIVAWGNMNPTQVAASMIKRFGVAVCMGCGQKRADAEKAKQGDVNAANAE